MNPATPPTRLGHHSGARAALWASAFVLAGLILVQMRLAGAVHAAPPLFGDSSLARAGMLAQAGGYTVLTSDVGNEDILVVLDSRNEELFIYHLENQSSVQLLERQSLPGLFNEARARAQGRK